MIRALALGCAVALPAGAATHQTPVEYSHSCNANGAVLDLASGERIYLGTGCDAFVEGGADGHWWYGASGFAVAAGSFSMVFPGADAPCDILPLCMPPE